METLSSDFINIIANNFSYTTDKKLGSYMEFWGLKNFGWVETLKYYHTNVYYSPSMPVELFRQHKISTLHSLEYSVKSNFQITDFQSTLPGLIHTLAQVRLNEKFIMPLFASLQKNNSYKITCGSKRFIACMTNGIDANDIPLIVLDKSTPNFQNQNWLEIKSSQEFSDLFCLNDLDHNIGIHLDADIPEVGNSIIRHSIYDENKDDRFKKISQKILNFWNKFITKIDNKIDITIWCTQETKALIQPSEFFNVSYVIKETSEWQFSFGKMTGAYKDTSQSAKLHLYLFDVVEPVNLNLLLNWPTEEYGTYYSKNFKSVLIDIEKKSTFVIIGNWVK